jgi:hypothetical protein
LLQSLQAGKLLVDAGQMPLFGQAAPPVHVEPGLHSMPLALATGGQTALSPGLQEIAALAT